MGLEFPLELGLFFKDLHFAAFVFEDLAFDNGFFVLAFEFFLSQLGALLAEGALVKEGGD